MSVPISNLTATWANSSIEYTAIGMNVNASSYAANSKLINLKTDGNSQFSVDADGNIINAGDVTTSGNVTVTGDASVTGNVTVTGDASVTGNVAVTGTLILSSSLKTSGSEGTSGQVLLSNGTGAAPSWGAAGLAYIGMGTTIDNDTLTFTDISQYSTIILQVHMSAASASRAARVEISNDNGSTWGSTRNIIAGGVAGTIASGFVTISNTGTAATNKTIQPNIVVATDVDATFSDSIYTTTATETVKTGIVDALRFSLSGSGASFSVMLLGIP